MAGVAELTLYLQGPLRVSGKAPKFSATERVFNSTSGSGNAMAESARMERSWSTLISVSDWVNANDFLNEIMNSRPLKCALGHFIDITSSIKKAFHEDTCRDGACVRRVRRPSQELNSDCDGSYQANSMSKPWTKVTRLG